MIDFIRQWVINIVTLVLFIVIVEMLLPGGKMKKYINLVTGTILIITIINPLIGLTGKKFDFIASQTKNSNLMGKNQIRKEGKNLEQAQLKQIIEVYRKNIIDQLEQNAEEIDGVKDARADVIINEDYQSQSFGEIKRAYLNIVAESKQNRTGSEAENVPENASENAGGSSDEAAAVEEGGIKNEIVPVEKVQTVKIGSSAAKKQTAGICDPKLRTLLEERISRIFGVSKENIIISQV
ncbi:MAG TPA: stage III sporulation protein AF [Clostridia bacterium]|nr:stage III sporulation protein AF [Clostridia bacterium]